MAVEVRGWIEDGELMAGVYGGEVRDEVKVLILYHYLTRDSCALVMQVRS